MDWNLLMGSEHPYDERLGYSWLELGRRDEEGRARYLVLGCGMKAVRGRSTVTQWLFIADERRVGVDLHLVDEERIPLTRDRLVQALGDDGRVFYTDPRTEGSPGARYRRAVDERLFGLGERRYEALLELLIRVRQPQLSKRPSATVLSRALTDALPPLEPSLLADLADAFGQLESDRDRLRAIDDARAAATAYLAVYRRYARLAARRRAEGPRTAQAEVDRLNRDVIARTAERDDARRQEDASAARLAELEGEDGELAARRRALDVSDAARHADGLEAAQRRLDERGGERELAAAEQRNAREQLGSRERQVAEARELDERAASELAGRKAAAQSAAQGASQTSVLSLVDEAIRDEDADLVACERAAAEVVEQHRRNVAFVLDRLDARERHATAHRDATRVHADRQSALADLVAQREAADEACANTCDEHVASARDAVRSWQVVRLSDSETAFDQLASWSATLEGPDPLADVVADAAGRALQGIAAARVEATRRRDAVVTRREEVAARIGRLERGEEDEPPPPHTRLPEARQDRSGAPFWRLVEFRDGVGEHERAGLEAALEAAGLLDAWIGVDGALTGSGPDGDSWVIAAGARVARDGVGLARMLEPVDEAAPAVDGAVVGEILRRIALDGGGEAEQHADRDAVAAVSFDGRYRHGLLHGRWSKARAAYIGRAARETTRLEQLALARREDGALATEQSELDGVVELLDRERVLVDVERRRLPDDRALRACHADVARAVALVRQGSDELRLADIARDRSEQELADAQRALHDAVDELALPVDPTAIATIVAAIGDLRTALAGLWPTIAARRRQALHLAAALEEHRRADENATERDEQARERQVAFDDARSFHGELAASVGAAVLQLQRRRAELDAQRKTIATQTRATRQAREEALKLAASADGQLQILAEQLKQASERRQVVADGLWRFAASGVLAVGLPELALPDLEDRWSVTSAVAVARRIEQEIQDPAGDEAWRRALRSVQEEVGALGDALSLTSDLITIRPEDEGTLVADVRFRGRQITVAELAVELDSDASERRRLLDEREREIIENHLIDEVAVGLHDRIVDAEHQVKRMHEELAARPTSTGMQLRLQWRTVDDGKGDLDAARRRLLRQTAAIWSPEDRAKVGGFLQARMQAVRDADPSRPWLDQLTDAFDYRAWHRFVVERRVGGKWRDATGPASGGERVLAATVPLFAATSAHYASAPRPDSPRLVLLDEAFAGVDDDSRAKCLGLLAAFDLDVVMTSEREWGCYPEVPGLGIAQLSRSEGIDAVLVTAWEWDGRERRRVETLVTGAVAHDRETLDADDEHTGEADELVPADPAR